MSAVVWDTPNGVRLRFPTDSKPYFRLDYVLGGRRRQPSVGKDRDAAWAEALRVDVLVAVDDGDLGELSAGDMFQAWFDEGTTHWSNRYRLTNQDTLKNHILPTVDGIAVADLRRSHIAAVIHTGSTPRVQEVIRSACSAALKWAEQQGWLTHSAASLLPPKPRVKASRSPMDAIDPDEIPDMVDVLALADWMAKPRQPKRKKGRVSPQPEERPYTVLVAAFCGLRLGEMLALRGKHVQGDVLHVKEQVQNIRGQGLVVSAPKWGSSRSVIIPQKAGEWPLAEWLQARAEQVGPDGLLFPSASGGVWDVSNYRRHVFNPARAAVWPGKKWSYHSLRHTFCTHLISQGVAINDVASMAGHSSPMVTANIYVGRQASALDRVRSVINGE